MNPSDSNGTTAMEVRITAWVLGEASAFEVAELQRLCAENPELEAFRKEMASLHGMLAEVAADDHGWKLSPNKRQEIETLAKAEEPPQPVAVGAFSRRNKQVLLSMVGLAACVTLALFVQFHSVDREPILLGGTISSTELETRTTANRDVAGGAERPRISGLPSAPFIRDAAPFADTATADSVASRKPVMKAEKVDDLAKADAPVDLVLPKEGKDLAMQDVSRQLKDSTAYPAVLPSAAAPVPPSEGGTYTGMAGQKEQFAGEGVASESGAPPLAESGKNMADGEQSEPSGLETISKAREDYSRAAYGSTRAEILAQTDASWEIPVPAQADLQSLTRMMEEVPTAEEAFSTFSLNISDASFKIAKAALDRGERPEASGIKLEQFYNAVDYGDPAPSPAAAVAGKVEQTAHPIIPGRNLVRVSLKTAAAGRAASQPLRLTLLVDQSGSMVREDRRMAMENALRQLGGMLKAGDTVSLIGFSRSPRLLADALPGEQGAKLVELANLSASEGGTNLESALALGEELALRHQQAGAQNRIVLFTDGAANLGDADPSRLSQKVAELRQKGIAFDIAGLGVAGVNDRLLGEIARHGNGRYYLVNGTDGNFAEQLAGAFHPAAENVKVQVRFNPERVRSYKLLGFEQDRLKTEDFKNDVVDAAELASEEAGIAIYQVEPLPGGTGEIGEVSVRFKNVSSGEMVERQWTIPYDPATPAFDQATPSMQLATLALLTAEKLRGGPMADAIAFGHLAGPIARVKQQYPDSSRVADLLRMISTLR